MVNPFKVFLTVLVAGVCACGDSKKPIEKDSQISEKSNALSFGADQVPVIAKEDMADPAKVENYLRRAGDRIRRIRASGDPGPAASEVLVLLCNWNPIGQDLKKLEAVIGEPTAVEGEVATYTFEDRSRLNGFTFRFAVRGGKIVKVDPEGLPLGKGPMTK